jgi:tetratricopeptide (TPR) repeat protein
MSSQLAISTSATLRAARVALRSARYDEALELLAGCADWDGADAEQAVLIECETIARRDPVAALARLAAVGDLFASDAGRFGYELEMGRTHANVGDLDSAQARIDAAAVLAARVPHGEVLLCYHSARLRWLRGDYDPYAPDVTRALAHSDPTVAASAHAVRGWLHSGRGDFAAQIADLSRALAFAATPAGVPVDVAVLAITCYSLARVAFETADAAGMAAARAAYERIAWTPDVAGERYNAMRTFAWDAFMRGQPGPAQRAFKEARAIAPSAAWRVVSHLDRAYVARFSRNEAWALEELAQADRLAQDVRWESTSGEERQALVILALLHAPSDAARAQRWAATYSRIGMDNVHRPLAIARDRRTVAFLRYAQGRIDQTLGRRDDAVNALHEAYEIFDACSHHYRAMLAASALAELTGEPRWSTAANAHARRYPGCPLASMAGDAVAREDAMPRALSVLQRQMARAMLGGAADGELSRRFSRSAFTVEREVRAVYDAFGVGSRAALLAEARHRGLA